MSARKSKCVRCGDRCKGWVFLWSLLCDCGHISEATPEAVKIMRRQVEISPGVMFVSAGSEIEVRGVKSLWDDRKKDAKQLLRRSQ